ncbi:MAG: twin-arginine translocation signal domain-containing protein, partial [Candidatus Acidiferrales bacterium]
MADPKDAKTPRVDRRDFLKLGAAATVGFLA